MVIRNQSIAIFAAAFVLAAPAAAEAAKQQGVIISQNGDVFDVRTREGSIKVVMTPSTSIKETSGIAKRTTREPKALIPGLIIDVDGDMQGDTITAEKIEFKQRDWRAAIAAKAGTTEQFDKAAAERAELRQAIIDGNEYVIQEEVTVYFPTGKSTVAGEYKQQLSQLAQKAPSFGNYRLSILGFADPRGDAAANERLSKRRADAVSNYLRQTGKIQPGRVLSPSAMGEGTVAPGENAPASNDEARRVVVRVVTPKNQLSQ